MAGQVIEQVEQEAVAALAQQLGEVPAAAASAAWPKGQVGFDGVAVPLQESDQATDFPGSIP